MPWSQPICVRAPARLGPKMPGSWSGCCRICDATGRTRTSWCGAIVIVPPSSNLYVLLSVDHHKEAYRWAEHRKLTINPVTGAMQVVLVEDVSAPPAPADAAALRQQQAEIEERFGAPLQWIGSAQSPGCHIRAIVPDGTYRETERWPEIHDAMIQTMKRLMHALDPAIANLTI